jgi:hypothetical protein
MSTFGHRLRGIARLLVISLLLGNLLGSPARAALITTEQAIATEQGQDARTRIELLLAREDVRAELIGLGVDPDQASARLARLNDAEVARIAGHLNTLPAGEGAIGAVVGAALFIFLVLLITDLLGLTDVYPFVR